MTGGSHPTDDRERLAAEGRQLRPVYDLLRELGQAYVREQIAAAVAADRRLLGRHAAADADAQRVPDIAHEVS